MWLTNLEVYCTSNSDILNNVKISLVKMGDSQEMEKMGNFLADKKGLGVGDPTRTSHNKRRGSDDPLLGGYLLSLVTDLDFGEAFNDLCHLICWSKHLLFLLPDRE